MLTHSVLAQHSRPWRCAERDSQCKQNSGGASNFKPLVARLLPLVRIVEGGMQLIPT